MKKCALKLAAFFAMVFLLLPVFKMEAAAWGEDAESITASGGRITVNWDGSRNCTEIEVVVDLNGSVIGRTGCDHGESTSYTFFAKEYYELFPEGGTVTATISYLTYYSEKISRSNSYVSCTLPSLERAKAPEVSLSTDGLLTVTTSAEIDGFSYEVIKYDTQDKKEIALTRQDISAPSAGTYQVDLKEKMTSGYRYYVDVKGTDSTHKKGTSLKTRTNEVDCNSNFPHGKYNYNVWWVYDPEEKCLTFSGNGYSTLPGAYFGENYDCWKDIRHVVKTIVIEESVVEIEAQAFTDFTALQNLYIPFAMQKIEKEFITYRLDDWRQLVQVTYAGSSADWEHFGFDKVITATGFCKDSIQFTGVGSQCGDNVYWTYLKDEVRNRGTVYIHGEGRMWDGLASNIKYFYADDLNYSGIDLNIVVKHGVTYVGAYDMIIRAKDVHVTLASSVSELGESCFYATDTLRDVTFRGNLIKVIPEDCFADSGIRTLVLPQGIEEIGANAFNDSALEEITIPTSVKKIGFGAFYTSPSNKHLKAIYYKGGGTAWSKVEAEYMNNTDKLVIMGYSGDYGKVTFSNGGVAQDFVDYVAKGDTKEDPGEPWARNHMLEGWFADEALTQEFDFTTPIEDDTTVYAKWIERSEVENLLTETPEKEVVEGATVSLIAPLRGGLFTYQWKKKEAGSTNYVDIEGANSKELTFTASLQDDGSKYAMFVYNKYGSSYSTGEVTLTVSEIPAVVITEQPADVIAAVGETASFKVTAVGEGLTYQWQYKNASASTWSKSNAAVAKNANMTFIVGTDKTLNGRQYRCVITDKNGKTVTSDAATLTVSAGPVITSQPVDQTAAVGETVSFKVTATGEGLTYQWQYKNASAATWSKSGAAVAKTANMTFTVGTDKTLNGRQYRCIVTDKNGSKVTSKAATLTVGAPAAAITITSQPANVTAAAGDKVTFSVKATGEGLTYQWQYRNAGATTWSNSGAAAAKTANMTFTLNTDKTLNGRQYRCIIKDKNGNEVISEAATLTVGTPAAAALAITSQPVNQTAAIGGVVSFQVTATGDGLTYQWQYKNASAANWSNSGAAVAKTANMTFTVGTDKTLNGRQYRCIVKDKNGNEVISEAATLTVSAGPAITSQPANQTAAVGEKVSFTVAAVGEGLTYQWQYKNASAANWSSSGVAAAKTANMTFTVSTDKALNGRQYRCIITDKSGIEVISNAATLTVK